MARVLLWAAIGVVVWWWIRRLGAPRPGAPRSGRPQTPAQQDMVRCAHCGVFLPRADAVLNGEGQPFCCAEHRSAASPP